MLDFPTAKAPPLYSIKKDEIDEIATQKKLFLPEHKKYKKVQTNI